MYTFGGASAANHSNCSCSNFHPWRGYMLLRIRICRESICVMALSGHKSVLIEIYRYEENQQESHAIAARTARCRCKFRHVGLSNCMTASCVRFPCSTTGLSCWYIFVCRLQWIIYQKVISIRKNQPDIIFIADNTSQSVMITLNYYRHHYSPPTYTYGSIS